MENLRVVKSSSIRLLYQMLYDVQKILKASNLQYWVIGGTFLGAVRHGGIIPWDDDIDIGIKNTDKKKFLSLEKILNKCGYSIVNDFFGYKIFYTDRKFINDFEYSYPFIDVFTYIKDDEGKWVLGYKKARDIWPNDQYQDKDLFPLQSYDFGDYSVLGPCNPEAYFKRLYGKDWNDVGYVEYDHSKEEEVKKVKVKLTKKMRVPAQPTAVKNRHCIKICLTDFEKEYSTDFYRSSDQSNCSPNCVTQFITETPVYVINCKAHKERLEAFNKSSKLARLKSCRISCVSNKILTNKTLCKMIEEGTLSKNADMTATEVAINFSHYKCWDKISKSCYDFGIVLEDDSRIRKNFVKSINLILKNIENFSIIHLFDGNWEQGKRRVKYQLNNEIGLVKFSEKYNCGGVGYIISKEYATYLISKFFPIKIPQDILMGNYPRIGDHYAIRCEYNRGQKCYKSPILENDCDGEGGTGNSTQTYDAVHVKNIVCKTCK